MGEKEVKKQFLGCSKVTNHYTQENGYNEEIHYGENKAVNCAASYLAIRVFLTTGVSSDIWNDRGNLNQL